MKNKEIIDMLHRNDVCFGGMPVVIRAWMQEVGVEAFVIRGETDWHHLGVDHKFKNGRTYRLDKEYTLKLYIPFVVEDEVLGIESCSLTYDAACSLVERDGRSIRFMYYVYKDSISTEMMVDGQVPTGGVWEVL